MVGKDGRKGCGERIAKKGQEKDEKNIREQRMGDRIRVKNRRKEWKESIGGENRRKGWEGKQK
jgi:hypothetical protein